MGPSNRWRGEKGGEKSGGGWGLGLAVWARVGGQMPRGRPEQVSVPYASHPMCDAGPRWSNKVQQGGWGETGRKKKEKRKEKRLFWREYYANLTRRQARGVSTVKRMILEIQTKKKKHFDNNYTCRLR